jgi:CspA family cold shock protein
MIKFFNEERGWGFVIPDDGEPDVYVHWKGCINSYVPQAGDIVQFELKEFPDGRRAARKVELAA